MKRVLTSFRFNSLHPADADPWVRDSSQQVLATQGAVYVQGPLLARAAYCIYVCPACYNGVGSEKFTASELYRCPNLSYNEDVLRERSIA